MAELRAPDPTLMEHPFPVAVELTSIPTAHHMGMMCNFPILPSTLAAFIAVPCRECFPDAPPPGHGKGWRDGDGIVTDDYPRPDLAWQVQP